MGVSLGITLGLDLCGDAVPAAVDTPVDIVAVGEQKAWFRADQGITLNGANVSGWANIWGNGDFVQATAASQLRYDASAIGGRPALTNPTADARGMLGTLTSGLSAAGRHYTWCMVKLAAPASAKWFAAVGRSSNSALATGATAGTWRALARGSASVLTTTAIAAVIDRPTLFELGNTAGGTASIVVSGTAVNTADPGAFVAEETALTLFGVDGSLASPPVGSVAEYVIMNGEPTAQQKLDMRAYFLARYGVI